ncbi:MAG: branched-chain amino acid ABC transporter permease [Acidimicrobiales bacterium]
MTDFLQLCFAGLSLGSRYALVALGFVVIHRATGVINFAQGSIVALGAYFTYNAHVTWGLPFVVAAILAVAGTAAVGIAVERVLLRRMTGQPVFSVIMVTIGLLFVIDQVITMIWSQNAQNLGDPWGIDTITAGGLVMATVDLWSILLAVAVVTAFYVFFRWSSTGLAMRAVAIDEEAAQARGISVRRVVATAWAIAGMVAAVAGLTLASGPAALRPSVGLIALAAFPAMILGGLDSPLGAVVGGVIIGVTQILTAGYQPSHAAFLGDDFASVTPYVVMILILMVRPYGLFGQKEVERL